MCDSGFTRQLITLYYSESIWFRLFHMWWFREIVVLYVKYTKTKLFIQHPLSILNHFQKIPFIINFNINFIIPNVKWWAHPGRRWTSCRSRGSRGAGGRRPSPIPRYGTTSKIDIKYCVMKHKNRCDGETGKWHEKQENITFRAKNGPTWTRK